MSYVTDLKFRGEEVNKEASKESVVEAIGELEESLRTVNDRFEYTNKHVRSFANSFSEASPEVREDDEIIEAVEDAVDELEQLRWKGAETEDIANVFKGSVIR